MVAPMLLDKPVSGELFRTRSDQVLVCDLHAGGIMVMDNSDGHEGAGIRAAIEAMGASLLYLLPYSPDLRGSASKPVENACPKLKAALRSAVERTPDGLRASIGRIIETFTPTECTN